MSTEPAYQDQKLKLSDLGSYQIGPQFKSLCAENSFNNTQIQEDPNM